MIRVSEQIHLATLANGLPVSIVVSDKFKVNTLSLFLHRPLQRQSVTSTALLPKVLSRGSRQYPDMRTISGRLDQLYGADVDAGVRKLGDVQSMDWYAEWPAERYLPEGNGVVDGILDLVAEMLTDPLLEDGSFKRVYVEQEKEIHRRQLADLVNDKVRYANFRCVQEMFGNAPFALHGEGVAEDLEHIDAASLFASYRDLIDTAPMSIVAVTGEPEQLLRALEVRFSFRRGGVLPMPTNTVAEPLEGTEPRLIVEEQPVKQGKLVLGLRTGVNFAHPDYFPLLVANGVLGGFSHSKLFRNVREKASLAYYAYSHLDAFKGIALISAGIEPTDFRRAHQIILEQIDALQQGDISEQELDVTKRTLVNQIREGADRPGALIAQVVDEELTGVHRTAADRITAVEAVGLAQVVAAAQRYALDTTYYLTATGQKEELGLA